MLKKIASVVCAVLGIIVIVLGLSFGGKAERHTVEDNTYRYSAGDYSIDYASFGADFYTYIYKGSKEIVSALDGLNKSAETIVKAENGIFGALVTNINATDDLIETVNKAGKLITMSIGFMIFAFGLNGIANNFKMPSLERGTTSASVAPDSIEEGKLTDGSIPAGDIGNDVSGESDNTDYKEQNEETINE